MIVGLLCWHHAALRLRRPGEPFQWEPRIAKKFNLNRGTFYRALSALEGAKLIAVERHPGCCPTITILPCEAKDP
jgi:hypothetical protein